MKNKLILYFLVFLSVNNLALYLGVLLMNDGPSEIWYLTLNKAPWTPPGWVFGAAWSSIMFFFSFYMTKLSLTFNFINKKLIILFSVQWILNVCWNWFFFNNHQTEIGLIILILLWLLIGYFTFKYIKILNFYSILIIPYLVWMTIATSLNAYIVFNN